MVSYDKWEGLEVSDDEEELAKTPSLDPVSLARFRHQRHLEDAVQRRRRARSDKPHVPHSRTAPPLRKTARELGREGFSVTRLSAHVPEPSQSPTLEGLVQTQGHRVQRWLALSNLEDSQRFLLEREGRELCSQAALDLVSLACLSLAEEAEGAGAAVEALEEAARQVALLQLILGSAEELGREAKDSAHLADFFRSLGQTESGAVERLEDVSRRLLASYRERARERRASGLPPLSRVMREAAEGAGRGAKAALEVGPREAQRAAETRASPAEAQAAVLRTLPADFAAAMRAQDREALERAALALSPSQLNRALRRCACVGLWRSPPTQDDDDGDDAH